jgi:hypothetical protein
MPRHSLNTYLVTLLMTLFFSTFITKKFLQLTTFQFTVCQYAIQESLQKKNKTDRLVESEMCKVTDICKHLIHSDSAFHAEANQMSCYIWPRN